MRTLNSLLVDVGTWDVVNGLNLTPAQMQALLPVARELRSEHEAIRVERVDSVGDFDRGIRKLRAELLANNGVTDEAKAAVAKAESGWKAIETRQDVLAPDRIRVIRETLTPQQVEFVAEYSPGAALRPGAGRGGQAGAGLDKAEALLVRVRLLTPQQFERAPQRLRQMLPARIPPDRVAALSGQVLGILTEARAMSDADFESRKGELAQRLVDLVPQRAGAAVAGRGKRGPAPDLDAKIARTLLTPALATVLEAKLGIAKPAPFEPPAAYPQELESLVNDVRLLNLVNSLYLTPEQMKALSGIISRAQTERGAVRPQVEAQLGKLITLASDVRGNMAAGTLTAQTRERIRTEGARGMQERRAWDARTAVYVKEVKGVLNDNQVCLVSEFIPCLIPVKNLTNPERIGQAQNTEGAEKMLARAREAPEQQVEAMLPRAQERLRGLLLHKHLPTAEVERKVAELPRVIEEARAMSDADFELHKADLVKRVAPPDVPAVHDVQLDKRIGEYLLSPNLLPIFEQRMAAEKVASK